MKFWDSSAVVALLVDEPQHAFVRGKLDRDPSIAVWWGTRVECLSALTRREREHSIDVASAQRARARVLDLADQMAGGAFRRNRYARSLSASYGFMCCEPQMPSNLRRR